MSAVFNLKSTANAGWRNIVAALLLMLPSLLAVVGGQNLFAEIFELFAASGDDAVRSFRANISLELFGAFCSSAAFSLLLLLSKERNVKIAISLLLAAEIYMCIYWAYMFVNPLSRPVLLDALLNMVLVIVVIGCCYGYSLLLSSRRLRGYDRVWVMFIFMSYIMSFVALYAPVWQRAVPSISGSRTLLMDNASVYVIFAFVWNVLRCYALWRLALSPLFAGRDSIKENEGSLSPVNRYTVAVLVASLLAVKGLELVYSNAFTLLDFAI